MKPIARSLKMTSIFFRIAIVMVASIGLVSGTITFVQNRAGTDLAHDFVAQMARSESALIADIVTGAVRFNKSEQVRAFLTRTIENSEGQLVAALAMGADENLVAEVAGDDGVRRHLQVLATEALTRGEIARSSDGLMVAMPLRSGADQAIVGAVNSKKSIE